VTMTQAIGSGNLARRTMQRPSSPPPDTSPVEAHRARILRYVSSMVRDAAEAEDVLQEVMLRASRGYADLRAEEALTTWLYRVATHACVDHLRRRARRLPVETWTELDELVAYDDSLPSLEQTVQREQMSSCVQRLLERLPDQYRSVIILADLEGLTAAEIGELLGLTLTTVKIRIHRGRTLLRKELEAGCSFSCDERGVLVCEPKDES
jgi:RNA polymerase sigma-70 factor (ECF subfamily)